MKLPQSTYKRHFVIFFYVVVFVALAFLAGFLIFGVLFPFLAAWIFAMLVRPLGKKAHKLTGASEKTCSTILCICILLIVGALCLLAIIKLGMQIKELPRLISDTYALLSEKIEKLCEKLGASLQIENGIAKGADTVRTYIEIFIKNVVDSFSSAAARAAKNVPSKIFSLVIFVISCVYFSSDLQRINEFLYSLVPPKYKNQAEKMKKHFANVTVKYIKAHLIMILTTFLMVYVGLVLLGYKYAAIISAIISVLDFLPAIGIGTVLIPWAIILFILGNSAGAIKLIVLYVVCEVINQIFRPKIIGAQLGIHPLATLVGLYVGLKFFGIVGMLLSPMIVILLKFALENFLKKEKTY